MEQRRLYRSYGSPKKSDLSSPESPQLHTGVVRSFLSPVHPTVPVSVSFCLWRRHIIRLRFQSRQVSVLRRNPPSFERQGPPYVLPPLQNRSYNFFYRFGVKTHTSPSGSTRTPKEGENLDPSTPSCPFPHRTPSPPVTPVPLHYTWRHTRTPESLSTPLHPRSRATLQYLTTKESTSRPSSVKDRLNGREQTPLALRLRSPRTPVVSTVSGPTSLSSDLC